MLVHKHAQQLVAYHEYMQPCTQWQVPRKMVNFNPGLSQILSKVFLSKSMQLELKN